MPCEYQAAPLDTALLRACKLEAEGGAEAPGHTPAVPQAEQQVFVRGRRQLAVAPGQV